MPLAVGLAVDRFATPVPDLVLGLPGAALAADLTGRARLGHDRAMERSGSLMAMPGRPRSRQA